MQMLTRAFGEIEIDESKVIAFPGGIIGFPDLQNFVLLYDEEQGNNTVKWLQSVEEPGFAMPVINPLLDEADKTIILDCKEMSYISSSGLRIFLTLRKAAEDKGGKIIIQNINDDIRSVFMMTGFLNLFEIR